jgi:hypothetical protein
MEREKYVDESWKESAAQEKERLDGTDAGASAARRGEEPPGAAAAPEQEEGGARHNDAAGHQAGAGGVDFLNYISGLGYQAMVFLGEIPNPVTNQPEKNLAQAKFVIDTLILLQGKTKGNLTKQEEDMLNMTAYELQVKYVELLQKEGGGD